MPNKRILKKEFSGILLKFWKSLGILKNPEESFLKNPEESLRIPKNPEDGWRRVVNVEERGVMTSEEWHWRNTMKEVFPLISDFLFQLFSFLVASSSFSFASSSSFLSSPPSLPPLLPLLPSSLAHLKPTLDGPHKHGPLSKILQDPPGSSRIFQDLSGFLQHCQTGLSRLLVLFVLLLRFQLVSGCNRCDSPQSPFHWRRN